MVEMLKDIKDQLEQKRINELEIIKIGFDNKELNDKLNLLDKETTLLKEQKQDYKKYKENIKFIKKLMLIIVACGVLCGMSVTSIAYFIKGIDLIPCIMSGALFSFTGLVIASVFMPNYSEAKEFLANHNIETIEEQIKEKEKEKAGISKKVKLNVDRIASLKDEMKRVDSNTSNSLFQNSVPPQENVEQEKNVKQKKIGTKK